MFDGRLELQMPFMAFIVIFYLKFNDLHASTLLEYYVEDTTLDPGDVNSFRESIALNDDKQNWNKDILSETIESEMIDENQKQTSKDYLKYVVNVSDSVDELNVWHLVNNDTIGNDALSKDFRLKLPTKNSRPCMLDGLKEYMMTWAYSNGSLNVQNAGKSRFRLDADSYLDASYRPDATDDTLAGEVVITHRRYHKGIVALSAAYDGLTNAPFKTLSIIRYSLKFLTLKGNNFSANRDDADSIGNEQSVAWASFPELPFLKELDISNCMIEFITSYAFQNLTRLEVLYISHNKILQINSNAFSNVPNLRHLDLSYMNNFNVSPNPLETLMNLLVSMRIEQHTFTELNNLEYLDLSYTKITRSSAVAFASMGEKLKYLSLCYAAIPMIGDAMFKNTALRGLDMSGNFYATYTITNDTFSAISDTLKFLFLEKSSLNDLSWLKKLKNLIILDLNSNNINLLSLDMFSNLTNLQLLDLSSNHIGNWYSRVFAHNPLKVFNIRDNNINILTSEMLMDFQNLDYLGIGDNNFLCDCVLRDLVDIAAANNRKEICFHHMFSSALDVDQGNLSDLYGLVPYNRFLASLRKYSSMLTKSYMNMKNLIEKQQIYKFHIVGETMKQIIDGICSNTNQIVIYGKINGSTLKFQLLDYGDEHYWCFNETEKLNLFELNCELSSFNDLIANEIRYVTKYVVICACTLIFSTLIGIVVYLKRWQIHYYYSSLKSASLLAVAAQENFEKFSDLSESDSNLMYDLFISYCESDRQWVLEELMPNIENAGDLSICMHERDFQVGLTILDNIISCMDRSRCLMLVISSNFLLSHWCQFEMRLAQHRMFEASKEHLILVFLEDIPRRKRPKTLQYLMDVKTYIKWPTGESTNSKWDERKIFWKRLRKSIKNIN